MLYLKYTIKSPTRDVVMTKIKIENNQTTIHISQPTTLYTDLECNFNDLFSSLQYFTHSDSCGEAHSIQIIILIESEMRKLRWGSENITMGCVFGKK